LALAEAALRRVLKNGGGRDLNRRLDAASLVPLGAKKWCWRVRYEWHPRDGMRGVPPDFDVLILMDGTVVEPVVRIVGKRG